MAQDSMFWTTNNIGDGVEYTQEQWIALWRDLHLYDPATEGIVPGVGSEYEVTGVASPVTVGSGRGIVYGFPCRSTASEEVAIPTPVIDTTGHRIVLRADWDDVTLAQTVQIALVSSSDGVAAPPAVTQVDGDVWEISLATLTITTGGVIAVTDTRVFTHFNTKVKAAMIEAIIQQRQGGSATDWCEEGTNNYGSPAGSLQQIGPGLLHWSGAGDPSTYTDIIFPIAFSAKPIIFLTIGTATEIIGTTFQFINAPAAEISTTGCRVHGYGTAGITDKDLYFYWLAIGPQ